MERCCIKVAATIHTNEAASVSPYTKTLPQLEMQAPDVVDKDADLIETSDEFYHQTRRKKWDMDEDSVVDRYSKM